MTSSARLEELERKFEENPRRYFAPLANEYRKSGDPERAVALCQQHLPQQPGHMSGHVVLAQSLFDLGKLDEAREAFQTALDLDPENLVALRSLGDVHARQGQADAARQWYHRVLEVDPRNPDVGEAIAALDRREPPAPAEEPGAAAPAAAAPAHPPVADHFTTQFPPPPPTPVFDVPVEGSFASGGDSPFVGLTPPAGGSEVPAPDTIADFEVQREAELFTSGFYAQVLGGDDVGGEPEESPPGTADGIAEAVDAPESELDHLFGGLALHPQAGAGGPEADESDDPFAEVSSAGGGTESREPIEMPDVMHAGADDLLGFDEEVEPTATSSAPAEKQDAGLPEWDFVEPLAPNEALHEERQPASHAAERPAEFASVPADAAQGTESGGDRSMQEEAKEEDTPFVTETMAELLLRQGFREQALDVYRKLLAAQPDDVRLQERVEELSAQPAQRDAERADPGESAVVAHWLARLVAARIPRNGATARASHESEDTRPIVPIESLLESAVEQDEEQAAGALAAATMAYREDREVTEQLLAASDDDPDSLEHVLREAEEREARLRAGSSFSFEQFFREPGSEGAPTQEGAARPADVAGERSPEPPSEEDAAAADLAEFHAWLAGLSRP